MATVFVTLKDITAAPSAAGTTVLFTWDTDRSVQLRVRLWDASKEDVPANAFTATEGAAAVGRRSLNVTLGAPLGPSPGKTLNYEITSVTAAPPTLRAQQGTVRIPTIRTVANKTAVPVRFYGFDGPMTTAPPAEGVRGNTLNYTWAQYNPLGYDETATRTTNAEPFMNVFSIKPDVFDDSSGLSLRFEMDATDYVFVRFWPEGEAPTDANTSIRGDAEVAIGPGYTGIWCWNPSYFKPGVSYNYEIFLDPSHPLSTHRLRHTTGSFQIPGLRVTTPFDVPVRFYAYTSDMKQTVPALGTRGNWSRYTWSQYNPRGT